MDTAMPDLALAGPSWLPVIDALLKSTLLLALAGAAALLLRRASAAVRHSVWTIGLAGALALPVLSLALPRWEVPVVTIEAPGAAMDVEHAAAVTGPAAPPIRRARAASREPAAARTLSPPSASAAARSARGIDPLLSAWPSSWPGRLGVLWFAGALAILGRLFLGLLAVQWMSRRTARVTDAAWLPLARTLAREVGIRSNLAFLQSDRATMPMAWGLVRPSVLMPADADAWPADRLRIVLLHELAHVRRRDCLTHVIAQLACAVHWFNPLVWMAARHARGERERACDDLVLAAGTHGPDYAEELLAIARVRRAGRFPVLVTGATLAMAHRTQLEGRLIAILDPKLPRSGVSRVRTAAATALGACAVLPLSTLQPWVYAAPAQTFEVGESVVVSLAQGTPRPEPSAAGAPAAGRTPEPGPGPEPQAAPRPTPATQPHVAPHASVAAELALAALEAISDGAAEGLVRDAVQGALEGAIGGIAAHVDQAAARREEPDPRTIAALTAALKDSDREVRATAMHALVRLRHPGIFEPLVAALKDSSADIREQAAMGLAQLRDPRAVDPLTAALSDQSASVREQVIFALGQLRDKRSAAAFAQALSKDESASVREQAAFALGQVGAAAYLDALAAALGDASASVREQAAFALGQLRDRRALEALSIALSDASASVREQAAFALGQIRDPAALDGLTIALRDAKPDIREQAAFALGQIRDARAVSPLISALKDADAEVRAQAAFALGQLDDRTAVEALVIAMRDENAEVRSQAAFALGQIGDPRAVDALTGALKDASAEVRRHAAFALGQIAR